MPRRVLIWTAVCAIAPVSLPGSTVGERLQTNGVMHQGEQLASEDGAYLFRMQGDGNAVVCGRGGITDVVRLWGRATPPRVVFAASGDGPSLRAYASRSQNDTHPLWHLEHGSSAVDRGGGSITIDATQKHRMFSTKRLGGPGTTLKISYRARTTLRGTADKSIFEGTKIGLKFPADPEVTGFSKDDPASVVGTPTGDEPKDPGAVYFQTGAIEDGFTHLTVKGMGGQPYEPFDLRPSMRLGYTSGTWKDVTITVEWLSSATMRFRYWHNADGSGTPVYESEVEDSPFASEPGFLTVRTDDASFEYDHITVTQR